jgi:tetratricopeptide (TPR) repeat protein
VSLGFRAEKNFDLRGADGAPAPAATAALSRAQREAEQRANSETQGAFNAGVIALTAGNGDEALKQFLLAAERKPCAAVYNRLGETYSFGKKYPEAVDAYQKATELKADEADYFDRLGIAAVQASRFDVAHAATRKR